MLADSSVLKSAVFLWGPWLLILAFAALFVFALLLFARRLVVRHGDVRAWRWLLASMGCGLLAFADVLALSIALGQSALDESPRGPWILAGLLLVCVIGMLGCGAVAIWRLLGRNATGPLEPPPTA